MVVVYVRFPLSLRNVDDLAFERGIDNCHETVGFWFYPFGPMCADQKRDQSRSHFRK
jgi:putative transposase